MSTYNQRQNQLQRRDETRDIFRFLDGDRYAYNIVKEKQEREKRLRQNAINRRTVELLLKEHHEMFPIWNYVRDGSDAYIRNDIPCPNNAMLAAYDKNIDLPVVCDNETDIFDIFKEIISDRDIKGIESITVGCHFDNTTVDVPHKAVLFQHVSNVNFAEYLKHQPRYLSPVTIPCVIGAKFDDPEEAFLITNKTIQHSRYLYKDFERIQFHDAVPKHDKTVRLCYGIKPKTVASIALNMKKHKVVIYKRFRDDLHAVDKNEILFLIREFDRMW